MKLFLPKGVMQMTNKLIGLVVALGVSGCATDSPIDNIVHFPSPSPTMSTQSRTSCATHQPVNQAIQNHDLDRLDNLLATLNRQPDCPSSYLDGVKRNMAYIAAAQAGRSMEQAQLTEAEAWLKRAPTMVWSTQVLHGDLAAYRKQWRNAAQYFNQAIDLINDPHTTPEKPAQDKIDKVFQSALDAQLLAGEVVGLIRPRIRPKTRSVGVDSGYPMPVQFYFGGSKMGTKGKKSTKKLADYLKRQGANDIKLIGHTDTKGSHRVNDRISKQRALAVKNYLRKLGVNVRINTEGKGKRKPLPLPRWKNLTKAEIDQRNRRVEFRMIY
jgi:outer membrane protein OmpA-like peptidoglycan-associated protein